MATFWQRTSFFALALAGAGSALAQDPVTPSRDAALTRWRAEHGANWRLDVDEGTGYAEFLYGGSAAPAFVPQTDAQWFELARQALAATQDLHGIEPATLLESSTLFLPLGMVGSSDKQTVRFRQVVRGVPVDAGWVNVLFDAHGRLLAVQTRALPALEGFAVAPSLDAETAATIAQRAFVAERHLPGSVVSAPELVVAQIDEAEQRVPRLTWKVDVQWLAAGETPEGFVYYVDAVSGNVLQRTSSIHFFDVGGTLYSRATPGVAPDTGSNPATQQPLQYARVQSPAGTVYTDAAGAFNFPGQAGPLQCTFTYVGTYNNVTNQAGAAETLVQSLTGTGNSVVMNPAAAQYATAQANAFIAVNRIRDWVRAVNPLDSTADFVHTANCNIASTCNAFFNGSSTNYYVAGGGCVNSSYSTVVAHEDGHWLNVLYGTGNGFDGMGEGNADVFAMYLYDTNIVAMDFFGPGAPIRDGLNTRQFCGDCCGGCYGEVHTDGETWMGAAWKVRRNLNNVLGNAAGDALADALFLGWMNSSNQTQIKSVIETQWLTLDDNDGNIGNGTPHFVPINNGFVEQGFPGVAFDPIAISGLTQYPDTSDENGPYPLQVTIASNVGNSITGATLRYRVGWTGGFASLPMVAQGGNVWSAAIAGQSAPTKVFYYVEATDSTSNSSVFPAAGQGGPMFFGIGTVQSLVCDSFETPSEWTASASSPTLGAWQQGDPLGTIDTGRQAQPEFDNTPGSGTLCWFTGQGTNPNSPNEADVDGGPRELTSTPVNIVFGNAQVNFAYWFYNDDGDDSLLVQVSNDGVNWVTARSFLGGLGGWQTAQVDVGSALAPGSSLQVRFSVSDSPNNSVTEAAIDDVCITTIAPPGCAQPQVFCNWKIDSNFCSPRVSFDGYAHASGTQPLTITLSDASSDRNGLLFYGYGTRYSPFQGGILCCQPPLHRLPVQSTNGNIGLPDCSGTMVVDFNAHIRSGADSNLIPGRTCAAQFYYRDPVDVFHVALSDAVTFTICP